MPPRFSKYLALLPEAAIVFMIGGVVFVLSGLGTQTRLIRAKVPANVPAKAFVAKTPARRIPALQMSLRGPTAQMLANESTRIEHARELLGKFYDRSVVKNGEKVVEVNSFIRQWTDRALRGEHKKFSRVIANAVLAESERHSFDPVFLMAVIENESSFDPHVIGPVGEIGLMQVTQGTGRWIAKKFGIKWSGKKSLQDPCTNIRIGAAYLAYLREEFDSHGQLYLAAYNMGSLNVNRALERSIWPKDYPQRVMKRYLKFYGDLKAELNLLETAPKT